MNDEHPLGCARWACFYFKDTLVPGFVRRFLRTVVTEPRKSLFWLAAKKARIWRLILNEPHNGPA